MQFAHQIKLVSFPYCQVHATLVLCLLFLMSPVPYCLGDIRPKRTLLSAVRGRVWVSCAMTALLCFVCMSSPQYDA
ncbi:uncharacterized protein BDZ83DRAFT_408403 [Colletotrichum acutatum]|uniref:Uncharacterized protein n=1 Tax=Glomerella acutata TaxID=27357 RepID=A0AAD8UHG3_GLOAC|nr:uncharacterized protein BDZ83DRAFT_408403 [Colletotrichum acutatum]KAK1722917.1 hypothetical protein BDZ83DRAFT_408403 [Colletotrichum acutatum]